MSANEKREGTIAVFTASNEPLDIRQHEVSEPQAGEALLALLCSGICGTDIHIHEGRLPIPGPFIPGHEFIGKVESLGAGDTVDAFGEKLAIGDAVIACAAQPCGECFNCQRGETASCLNFGVTFVKDPAEAPHFFGGFGEYLLHPVKNLIRIPEGLNVDAVAALPCAGPTMIRAETYGGGFNKDEIVVVQGTGPVGLFAVAYAVRCGCHVVAIGSGSTPERLKLAEEFGAQKVFDYRASTVEDRHEYVLELAKKYGRADGADVVIEASGSPKAFPEGLGLVRTRGRYLVPGQYSDSGEVSIPPHLITLRALRVIGSGQYTLDDVKSYLDFLAANEDVQVLFANTISDRFAVADANTAIARVSNGECVKAVFSS